MHANPFHLILGSQSPRRKELIGMLQVPFYQVVSDGKEYSSKQDPIQYVEEIAQNKRDVLWPLVWNEFSKLKSFNPFLICSDTIVVINQQILNKPENEKDALRMLKMLVGKTHQVMTAVSCYYGSKEKPEELNFVEISDVTFFEANDEELKLYIQGREPMDKAGSYGIQGEGQKLVKEIKGNYSGVVGFPLGPFCDKLKKQFSLKDKIVKDLFVQEKWF